MTSTPAAGARAQLTFGSVAFAASVDEHLRCVQLAERLGYDLVAYGDSQNLAPEMFVALALAAQATERVQLASTVTNPVTRHPAVMASAAAAVQQAAHGRFRLGIATGDSALENIGLRAARLDELDEYIDAVRRLCRGERAAWRGVTLEFGWPAAAVPIWMSAEGPRSLELAGRVADGVILGGGVTPDVVTDTNGRLDSAAIRAGRDPATIERWWLVKPILTDHDTAPADVWRELAWTLSATANHVFRHSNAGKQVPADLVGPLDRLLSGYRSAEHNRPNNATGGPHNSQLVGDELLEFLGRRFMIVGPPDVVSERLCALVDAGVTAMLFPAVYPDNPAYIERLWHEVLVDVRDHRPTNPR